MAILCWTPCTCPAQIVCKNCCDSISGPFVTTVYILASTFLYRFVWIVWSKSATYLLCPEPEYFTVDRHTIVVIKPNTFYVPKNHQQFTFHRSQAVELKQKSQQIQYRRTVATVSYKIPGTWHHLLPPAVFTFNVQRNEYGQVVDEIKFQTL